MTIYTSPDGGHTVYTEDALGRPQFVSEDETARRRRRLGYLQQAFRIAGEDDLVQEYLDEQIREVLVYARLRGHAVEDWSEQP